MDTMERAALEPQVRQRDRQCCPPAKAAGLDEAQLGVAVRQFKALADPTRLRIVATLAANEAPICVCDLNTGFDLEQPTISHHLKVLRQAGLVSSARRGSWAYYRLHPAAEGWVREVLATVER